MVPQSERWSKIVSELNRKQQQKTDASNDRISPTLNNLKSIWPLRTEQGILKGRLKSVHQEQDPIRTQRSVEVSVASERSQKRNRLSEAVNEQEKKALSLGQMRRFEDNHSALLLCWRRLKVTNRSNFSGVQTKYSQRENTNWRDCGKAKIKSGAIRKGR